MDGLEIELLGPDSAEFIHVKELFYKEGCLRPITYVEAVHNQELKIKHHFKKWEYERRYGNYRIIEAFHGTDEVNIPSILRNNLDPGRSHGGTFGAGVYFSTKASVSLGYVRGQNPQMLLCNVLVGNVLAGSNSMKPPLIPGTKLVYDTTANDARTLEVLVKFEEHTFLPKYVIHFQ